jgi:hypothetical protein
LPAGPYVLDLTARTEDGQVAPSRHVLMVNQ